MNINPVLREGMVLQADAAFLVLVRQVDLLYDQIGFYMQRYTANTNSEVLKLKDLDATTELLGKLFTPLGETLQDWKIGVSRRSNRMDLELNVLNEIWANILAIIYFLMSHDIDPDPFDQDLAGQAFATLVRANRLLT